ncbi:PREDICTED: disease resistance protein RML1A-like [Prunus mume]|uniref:Disease resistance protein RML1A-like n=1 Tax=Prunus mume TaxID=102107 RepID=A0ABM0NYS8_PRUMU|nr:PREDICTED: disease resistance protein RML1A-like [Prunus mume]
MALVKAADPQTSSSNASRYCRYHVFLSFRGPDTRKTFTDHLYTALVNEGFRTFRDDDEVERGEGIKPELQKAIKHSRTSVIVFSKDYASSRWCLDELVMILERKRRTSDDHVVLPVFYDVDPSHVRKQTGSLAKAFARHQKSQPLQKVKAWREALAEVADLAGMVLQNQAHGYESKFIKKIVKVIGDKLSRTPLSVAPNLVGMHSKVERINFWLQRRSTDVGILVIYGMSGIGKTTIAKTVYNSNFRIFEGSSFLENIKEVSQQPNGLVQIQTQLLSDILNGRKMKISNVSEGLIKIEDAMSSKRFLLVLDDVDHMDQLDAVFQMKDRFYPGSKIIITTRCARLLKAHQVTEVYAVETLTQKESLELFSWHAFGQDHPVEDYVEYSKKLVDHCEGLPLALKVLGSSLLGESICLWKSALEKLEAIPNGEIINKLRVSYDSLQDDHDRNLFLHIACFFIGKDKDYIVNILDGCDFYTLVGIQNLIDRCLVIIDGWDKVQMHNLIRGMGREIVRLESKEPWKRSRVWHHKDSFKILTEKNGTETIEGLVLDMHMCPTNSSLNSNEKVLETNSFSRMHELKLLHLSHVKLDGCYAEFCTGLRWLCWLGFPLDSIPTDFPVGSLIVLEMQYSGLKQIYKGTKCLPSLKILDLSHSHSLTETIDFSYCPNLETLVLVDCTSLIYVHGSIGNLERLMYLNMKDCKSLRMLPKNICMLKSLETFIISGCSNLNELSIEMLRNMDSLKVLKTDGIPISELWLKRSSSILGSLPCSLVELSLWGCNLSDDTFPIDFSNLSSLQRLNLGNNPIGSLPNCIKGLTRLRALLLNECTSLKSLLGLPKLNYLDITNCISLEKITYQSSSSRESSAGFGCNYNLVEWEYKYKLQPIGSVDAEMINLLGLCNLLESMEPIRMDSRYNSSLKDNPIPVQGLYQHGIFSTFFGGNEVPGQFSHKSRGSSLSFTVPLLDNHRTRGLIVFVVYVNAGYGSPIIHHNYSSQIIVKNKSNGLRGAYCPSDYGIPGAGEDMIWLSHWNLDDQLQGGDEVVVSVIMLSGLLVKELGIQLVQVQQEENYNMMTISTDSSYDDQIWYNKRLGDSDEEDKREEVFSCFVCLPDEEEAQQDDITVATTTGSNNSGGLRGWKVLAVCFCCPVGMKM